MSRELLCGCSEDGTIDGKPVLLVTLRAIRDKQIDVLKGYMDGNAEEFERKSLDECLTDLVEQHNLWCLSPLRKHAATDFSGVTLSKLNLCDKLCRMVANREQEELAKQKKRAV
jgi:hypothetical protein